MKISKPELYGELFDDPYPSSSPGVDVDPWLHPPGVLWLAAATFPGVFDVTESWLGCSSFLSSPWIPSKNPDIRLSLGLASLTSEVSTTLVALVVGLNLAVTLLGDTGGGSLGRLRLTLVEAGDGISKDEAPESILGSRKTSEGGSIREQVSSAPSPFSRTPETISTYVHT